MKRILPFLLFTFSIYIQAQVPKFPVTNIAVSQQGKLLQNPWAGGLNAPQFCSVDLNNDGINDLFVFDRGSDKVLTFLNDGSHSDTAFSYAPQYEKLFPYMNQWAVLADYNHDGIPDIFTLQSGEIDNHGSTVPVGIKVYKGSRVAGNLIYNVVSYCLYYFQSSYAVNLIANGLGQPAVVDVNGDGDLDILTFGIYGTAVEYFENQTIEQGLPADSLRYNLASSCWGNFYVGNSNLGVDLNVSCKGTTTDGSTPRDERHTGAALSALDYGNDGDIDLILSGAHVNYMALLNNTGNSTYANIGWQDTLWPSCNTSVHLPYFPGTYQVDADNDGHKDLLVSPLYNASSVDVHNVMLYRYTGNDTCTYQYSGNDSFLVGTMIDVGTDSKAVFFDYNGDSLVDIIVGNYYAYNPSVLGVSKLSLYQNTGTNTQPAYSLITDDFAGLSIYSQAGSILGINPAFGDLDGDGKPDMLIGDANGDLDFFKNAGAQTATFPSMTAVNYFSLHVIGNAAPFIYDVNGDSLPDLLVGRIDGGISYYWNFGTKTLPLFSPDSANHNFGQVNATAITGTAGNSQPFGSLDSAGNLLLFVGSDQGLVFEYLVDRQKLHNGNFSLIDSNFLKYNAGARVTMQACDINGDGKPEYIIGNALGGLQMFSETLWDSSNVLSVTQPRAVDQLNVYPNPANDVITLVKQEDWANLRIDLFNLLGEKINITSADSGNKIVFSTGNLNQGIYILRVMAGNKSFVSKIVIEH